MRNLRSVILVLACVAAGVVPAFGQDAWVGRKFMPKYGCVMKVGNRQFETYVLPFVVQRVSGEWLWVGGGWVQKSRVVAMDGAATYYTEYLRDHPTSAWAYRNRGVVWQAKGEYENSLKDKTEAYRLSPVDPIAANNVAWLLATCPDARYRDGGRAITMARKACELSDWKDAKWFDTLAAAYAEAGDFDTAIRWQRNAMEMLASDAEFVKKAHERLALYQDGKPYHEKPR